MITQIERLWYSGDGSLLVEVIDTVLDGPLKGARLGGAFILEKLSDEAIEKYGSLVLGAF